MAIPQSSNATPSAFGWDFQFNAAVIIMLNAIKDAKEVKVEGATEDIEVFLENDKEIFAQAKSCMNPDDASNALRDLNKALGTLSTASETGRAQSLVFVTNRADPFKKASTIQRFSGGYSQIMYSELPDACRARIDDIISRHKLPLEKELLSVVVFDFAGSEPNRYRIVKQRISEFLATLDDSYIGWTQRAMERWQLSFGKNASDLSKRISKQDMMWPLIVWMCAAGKHDWLLEYDEGTCNAIESEYCKIITEASERFEFITKVLSEYDLFKRENNGLTQQEVASKFIETKSSSFRDEFDFSGVDDDVAELVMRLTVERVLRAARCIAKVRKAVNL